MAEWHHRLDGRESEWTLGVGNGQGGLACCDSWDCKELDTTEQLNWTDHAIGQHQKIKVGKINILHLFIKNTFLFLAYTKGLSFIYWKLILSYTIIEAIQLCKFWQIEYVTFPQWSRYRTVPSLWNSGKTSVLILEGRIPQGVQDCEAGPELIGYTVCVGAHLGQKWEVHILRRVWKPVQVRGTQYRQHGL